MSEIIGRTNEKKVLNRLLTSKQAEFLALYGRRRIGKTYLIKHYFENNNCVFFHATGIQDGKMQDQLVQFSKQIGSTFYNGAILQAPKSWIDAFEDLMKAIQQIPKNKKVRLFDTCRGL